MDSWPAARVPALPGRGHQTLIWDTASGGLAPAAAGPTASIYACGITPYDATHIGHAATYIAWDLLIRSWRDAGHDVRYAQNITDVDDPLLERAERDGENWRELADREIDRFRSDMTALRLLPPDYFVGAVEALGLIEEFAVVLADRGSLYELDGDVYFCRSADAHFGSVSRLTTDEMIKLSAERGGDPGRPGKKDPLDPRVWLTKRPGEPSWDSRFGPGRPGWHVECAAIATRYLGDAFDVQAGGSDLIFPHHEMSASHARVALGGADGEAFARRYAHAGMVRLDGEKMSKSLGNLVFVSGLREAGADPMAIRLAILAHHYRHDWDWSEKSLAEAAGRLQRWRDAVRAANGTGTEPGGGRGGSGGSGGAGSGGSGGAGSGGASSGGRRGTGDEPDGADGAGAVLAGIRERLADDLDAPGALAVVDRWADAVLAGRAGPANAAAAAAVRDAIDALLGVAL